MEGPLRAATDEAAVDIMVFKRSCCGHTGGAGAVLVSRLPEWQVTRSVTRPEEGALPATRSVAGRCEFLRAPPRAVDQPIGIGGGSFSPRTFLELLASDGCRRRW